MIATGMAAAGLVAQFLQMGFGQRQKLTGICVDRAFLAGQSLVDLCGQFLTMAVGEHVAGAALDVFQTGDQSDHFKGQGFGGWTAEQISKHGDAAFGLS